MADGLNAHTQTFNFPTQSAVRERNETVHCSLSNRGCEPRSVVTGAGIRISRQWMFAVMDVCLSLWHSRGTQWMKLWRTTSRHLKAAAIPPGDMRSLPENQTHAESYQRWSAYDHRSEKCMKEKKPISTQCNYPDTYSNSGDLCHHINCC